MCYENFIIPCDCSGTFLERIQDLLMEVDSIFQKMKIFQSDFQILLFRNLKSIETYKLHLVLSENEYHELIEKLTLYKNDNKCAIFSYSRIVVFQDCGGEPIDAGTLLEEVAHFKLGQDQCPSYYLNPDQFPEQDILKRGIAYVLHHFDTFKLIQDCGGGEYIRARKILLEDVQRFAQAQSIDLLKDKELFSQFFILPILELLELSDEAWKNELVPSLKEFFIEIKRPFMIYLDYKDLEEDPEIEITLDFNIDVLKHLIDTIEENLIEVYKKYF